jgi:Family of unknown function (DUF5691)
LASKRWGGVVMNAWETLVASALVGTTRQEPTLDFTHPALSDYATQIQSQSAIQQILSAARLLATYQSVGNSPAPAITPLLKPATVANFACCSNSTTRYLSAILSESKYEPILPELLQLLAKVGQTVPPEFLPVLLDLGKRERDLQSAILPILGNIGQWLVRQNPDWEYAIDPTNVSPNPIELQSVWMTGTRTERLAALTQWRQIQPIESCQAVAANWKQDKADDRLAWLEVLQTNLSLADEELLEIALFDRSEPVRHQAADLLRQLPSQYRQRLTELASKCLTIKTNGDSYQLELHVDRVSEQEWQAAKIEDKTLGKKKISGVGTTNEKWYLLQVFSTVYLAIWTGDVDRIVTALVQFVGTEASSESRNRQILTGLVKAARSQQRIDWIEALLNRGYSILDINEIQQLVRSLTGDISDFLTRFFKNILTTNNSIDNLDRSLQIIITCFSISADRRWEWSSEISILVIQHFDRYIQNLIMKSNEYYYQQQNLANLLGRYLDISVLPDIRQMQSKLSIDLLNYNTCIEFLEFRRDMRSSFNTA